MDKKQARDILVDALSEVERTQIMMTHCRNKGGYHEPFVIEQTVRNNILKEKIKAILGSIKEDTLPDNAEWVKTLKPKERQIIDTFENIFKES